MPSVAEMEAEGEAKLRRKAESVARSYEGAKTRAVTNFPAVGFGPTRAANYQSGVQAGTYRAPDPGTWSRNWSAKMAE